jgi:hypothetical protein
MIRFVLIATTLQMICMMSAWERARLSAPETPMARITDERQIAA